MAIRVYKSGIFVHFKISFTHENSRKIKGKTT